MTHIYTELESWWLHGIVKFDWWQAVVKKQEWCWMKMLKFNCTKAGEMKEYVGYKIILNWAEWYLNMMQPALVKSFEGEFDKLGGHHSMKCDPKNKQTSERPTIYCSGIGKLTFYVIDKIRDIQCCMGSAMSYDYGKGTALHGNVNYNELLYWDKRQRIIA